MKLKEYEKEPRNLQTESYRLQDWVVHAGLRVVVVFSKARRSRQCWDDQGDRGACVSPRVFRLVAFPAPSDRERTQYDNQRYQDALRFFPSGYSPNSDQNS